MNGMALRLAAAVLLTVGGFCAGDARRQKRSARRRTLEDIVGLLTRIQQEISCRRTDLHQLYRTLASEYPPDTPLGRIFRQESCFQKLQRPSFLEQKQAACFAECFAGLGHSDAKQECARLDYYLRRFEDFLARAKEEESISLNLDRRLGLAAGAILGLLML